ncbi:MAG: hypothetical protein ACE361_09835 [Aureliella sp.]
MSILNLRPVTGGHDTHCGQALPTGGFAKADFKQYARHNES